MNDYKITEILNQQTPILHFQSDAPGATLRPTEVKPKLDRFLIKKCRAEGIEIPPDWLLRQSDDDEKAEKKSAALDYKMRIRAVTSEKLEPVPSIYYGNTGNANANNAYCIKGDCELTIFCFEKSLKEFIDKNLAEFFITHNFGRMQDKGFGSYIVGVEPDVKPAAKDIANVLTKYYGAEACYYISGYKPEDAYPSGDRGRRLIFDCIKDIYQVMKAGYNRVMKPKGSQATKSEGNDNVKYHRSVLFEYFHEKDIGNEKAHIGNEKAYIKKNGLTPRYGNTDEPFYRNHPYQGSDSETDMDYMYVRALLGLSEQFLYTSDSGGETIKIESTDGIERFASPIFFKVINGTIYMVAGRIDDRIYDKNFRFTNITNMNRGILDLNTPKQNMFDIDEFMEYFFLKFKNKHESDGETVPPIRETLGIGKEMKKIKDGESR